MGFLLPASCAVVSPPRKQFKGQCWLLSSKGPREHKDHTVPGAWCDASSAPGATRLQAASSLGFTWQSHDLIPNTEHSAALQTRPLKRSHWCKFPEQWLPASAWNDPTICLKCWCVQFSCSQNNLPGYLPGRIDSQGRDHNDTLGSSGSACSDANQHEDSLQKKDKWRLRARFNSFPKGQSDFFPYSYNLKLHNKQSACPYYFQVADPKYFHWTFWLP